MTCGYREHWTEVEPALKWLESEWDKSPPEIRTATASVESPYRISVPNNDWDVAAREWAKGRAKETSALRTMKDVQPRRLHSDGPHVQYAWHADSGDAAAMLGSLRTAARCLHTLGWGIDMAVADITEKEIHGTVYAPAEVGPGLNVPMVGTLDDLFATYERFSKRANGKGVDTDTRPSMLKIHGYRLAGEVVCPSVRFNLTKLDSDEFRAVAWEHCMHVAGWLRHSAAERLRTELDAAIIEQYVQGHTGSDAKSNHISYVPLPSIYGGFADGLIRRVLIVEPNGASGEIGRLLGRKLNGCVLSNTAGDHVCCLGPADDNDWTFKQYLPPQSGTVWRSVTPLILHGHNVDRRGVISVTKTDRLLSRAFEMAGYGCDDIQGWSFQGAPFWSGTRHAAAIRVPDHLTNYPRLHVEIRFRRPVYGPVLAGIGRHYGIGVFAVARGK
jgi:CRISPR-associated protein Csb2